uniref:type I protein arginine methyltransferase n=1 Tax=Anopheles dirus TaxID=7168 RepID=A0A182N4R1_9DIPT
MSDEDDCPPLCDMDTKHDSNGEEDEWEVAEEQNEPVKCLFCDTISPTMTVAIRHAKQAHDFDLAGVRRRFHLDEYSYIKMINYIRREKPGPEQFKTPVGSSLPWADDKYLQPVANETWLMFDLDELDEIMLNNGGSGGGNVGGNGGSGGEKENGNDIGETMTLTTDQYRKLQGIINDLTAQLREKENLLQHAASSIEKMKESFRNVLAEQQQPGGAKEENGKVSAEDGVGGERKLEQIKRKLEHCVSSVSLDDDQSYFNTYSHFGIHHDMLSDEVRTSSYRDAILRNADIMKDKTVLDLGCGTAILSMFAARAGAKEVVSVDQSDIIYQAMDIVRKNNIDNIRFVKGRLEDTELPVEKVDIIVSEWMGYFLLFEGMMDSVIYARKRYLREGGLILPNRCNISIAGYGDLERHNEFIGFWKNVYGFDMSCMKKEVLREATVEVCNPEHIITNANIIANFDLMEVDVDCPNFSYDFELTVKRDTQLTALVGYFDTFFELPEHIEFSTSPYSRPTHWKQTIFYLEEPVPVREGQSINGKFVCRRDPKDVRSLFINIEVLNMVLKYTLN